jgi:hypothetical protein
MLPSLRLALAVTLPIYLLVAQLYQPEVGIGTTMRR